MIRFALVAVVMVLVALPLVGQQPATPVPQPAAPAPAPTTIEPTGPITPPAQEGMPLTLDQAVATALRYNPGLRVSEEGIAIARDRLAAARAARMPDASAQVVYTRVSEVSSISMFFPNPDTGEFELRTFSLGKEENVTLQGVVTAPVYTGGALTAGVRAAKAGVEAAALSSERERQQIAFAVRQNYYGVLTALEQTTVARQNLAAAEEQLRVARAFFEAGSAPQFDVIRAEAGVQAAQLGVTAAVNQEKLARAALNNVMGVSQDCVFNLTTALAREQVVGDLGKLESTALAQRPDLLSLRANERALRERITIARAQRRPTVGLNWTYTAPVSETTFSMGGWTLSLAASLDIFNFGRTRAAVNEARHTVDQTMALEEQLRQGVSLQVRQAYLNANTAFEQISTAAAQLRAANEALRIAQVRYREGEGTLLEVTDAQAARESAATNYNAAVFNYNVAVSSLELALGSGPVAGAQPVTCPLPAGRP